MTGLILTPRQKPTFYFIGVTTSKSSINAVFPAWMALLGLDVELAGIDLPVNAPPEDYRAIIQHMRDDPMVRGGLVTTHKINIVQAASDLFESLDDYAKLCGEISGIARRNNRLEGYACDPVSSAKTWRSFVPPGYFGQHPDAEVLCFGCGGTAIAITVGLADLSEKADRPHKMTLVDVSPQRLEHARATHNRLNTDIVFEYVLNQDATENDNRMMALPARSMVINATGMGKDLPGSPVTDAAVFPQDGIVWELNYRGELSFLHQAEAQAASRHLKIEDGWNYFLHGWTQVLAAVFQIDLTPVLFTRLGKTAEAIR